MAKKDTMFTAPKSRLCIYFFYDPDGIVDEYVFDCLNDLAKNVDLILFVSNSTLNAKSRTALKSIKKVEITERLNKGFDVWAYKHGIDTIGWEKLMTYDEVIFMNFTIVGPLYPLKEMFMEMDKRPIDFWGINVHSGEPYDPWGIMEGGVIPKHLQSHFIAVRKKMLQSPEFQQYWVAMRPINSYQEAIGFHEAIFTQTFQNLGYTWDSYVDTSDLERLVSYPLMFMPKEVILHRRSPFFKRKALLLTMDQYIGNTAGETVRETLDALQDIGYDVGKVMPNILRTGNQYDIRMLHSPMTIINDLPRAGRPADISCLIAIYIDSEIKLRAVDEYMPALTSLNKIVIVHPKIAKKFPNILNHYKKTKLAQGQYLDLLECVISEAKNYSIVGIMGLGSYSEHRNGLSEYELYKQSFESLFSSHKMIEKIVGELFNNKNIGVFAAPQSVHGNYGSERYQWHTNYKATDRLLKALDVHVDRNPDKPAFTSETGFFWIKSSIIHTLPLDVIRAELAKKSDQKIRRVFGFALPFITQSKGYLMSYTTTQEVATDLIMALSYRKEQQQTMIESFLREGAPISSPPSRIYYRLKGAMSERHKVTFHLLPQDDGSYKARTKMPVDSDLVRFDPIEGRGIICKGVTILINGERRKAAPRNAITYHEDIDVFLTNDPQYAIEGAVTKGDDVIITIEKVEFLPRMKGGELQEAFSDMKQYYEMEKLSPSGVYNRVGSFYRTLMENNRKLRK